MSTKQQHRTEQRRKVRRAVANSDITHLGAGRGPRAGYGAGPRRRAYGEATTVDDAEVSDEIDGYRDAFFDGEFSLVDEY